MSRSFMVRGTLLLLVTGGTALGAQTAAAAALGATLQREEGGLWHSSTRLDPAVRFDNPWVQIGGDASLSGNAAGGGLRLQTGSVSMLGASPGWRGFQVSNTASLQRFTSGPVITRTLTSGESAVSYSAAGNGAWLGFGLEQSPQLDSGVTRPLLRAGVWRQFRSVMVSLSVDQHAIRTGGHPASIDTVNFQSVWTDTLGIRHTTSAESVFTHSAVASQALRWSDVQARIGWSSYRIAFDAQAGVAHQLDSRPASLWGRVTTTAAVAPRLSIVAAIGTDPTHAWMGLPPSRFASLGVRVAPAALSRPAAPPHVRPSASSFAVRAAESGTYVVTMHVPNARTVELSGDFNQWHAVALHQVLPDVWEATLPLAPGTYHVNMRVNGDRWTAPPGLTATTDDFNGTVGLLVVR